MPSSDSGRHPAEPPAEPLAERYPECADDVRTPC